MEAAFGENGDQTLHFLRSYWGSSRLMGKKRGGGAVGRRWGWEREEFPAKCAIKFKVSLVATHSQTGMFKGDLKRAYGKFVLETRGYIEEVPKRKVGLNTLVKLIHCVFSEMLTSINTRRNKPQNEDNFFYMSFTLILAIEAGGVARS